MKEYEQIRFLFTIILNIAIIGMFVMYFLGFIGEEKHGTKGEKE